MAKEPEIRGTILIDKEQTFNDPIFSGEGGYSSFNIRDDVHYKKPKIKTWVYTNVDNRYNNTVYWVKINGIPLPAEYTIKLQYAGNYKKGVYIIMSFTLPPGEAPLLELLKPIFKNKIEFIPISEREKIYDIFNRYLNKVGFIDDINFRITYFIPEEYYKDNDVVRIGDIETSTNISNLFKEGAYGKDVSLDNFICSDGLLLELRLLGPKDTSAVINIGGDSYKLNAQGGVKDNALIIRSFSIDEEGLAEVSTKSVDINTNNPLELINDSIDADTNNTINKMIDHENKEIESLMKLYQLILDKKINLTKLMSTEYKAYISSLGLTKAEIDMVKDGLKNMLLLLP